MNSVFGTKPVHAVEDNQMCFYQFSGMISGKQEQGIKICLTRMNRLVLKGPVLDAQISDNEGNTIIAGRKNHPMSYQSGRIFTTGGTDSHGKILQDFLCYSQSQWKRLDVRTITN